MGGAIKKETTINYYCLLWLYMYFFKATNGKYTAIIHVTAASGLR
jgi:hypothetical protein